MRDAAQIAEGLNPDTALLLKMCREEWFAATDLSWSRAGPTGNALTRLAERGMLERRTDPTVWGRGQYQLTPLGLEVRAHLKGVSDA